jgi:hypothetical protein
LHSDSLQSTLVVSDLPGAIKIMLNLGLSGRRAREFDNGRVRNRSNINDLPRSKGTPRDIVIGLGNNVGLSIRLGLHSGDGDNVGRVVGILGSKTDELVGCKKRLLVDGCLQARIALTSIT